METSVAVFGCDQPGFTNHQLICQDGWLERELAEASL